MVVELINTGSELMLGRVLNTHQQWLCRRLADLGYVVSRQVSVADTPDDIQQAVREALGRADLVITTGGLGPTSDDLTRDLIAQMLGRRLRQDTVVSSHIQQFFTVRKRPMPERTRVQAEVPEGALVLNNPHGTAPGLAMQVNPNRFRPGGTESLQRCTASKQGKVCARAFRGRATKIIVQRCRNARSASQGITEYVEWKKCLTI